MGFIPYGPLPTEFWNIRQEVSSYIWSILDGQMEARRSVHFAVAVAVASVIVVVVVVAASSLGLPGSVSLSVMTACMYACPFVRNDGPYPPGVRRCATIGVNMQKSNERRKQDPSQARSLRSLTYASGWRPPYTGSR
ncbi:hypothetical protein GTR04_3767 [Trichophyton interdigitale]|nr:hypothetical protein GY631_1720 [Trichophyton interdigitale]KAG8208827.1 hypothetical protein GTR04_3767 [Trichophyton interdigitale]